MGLEKLGRFCRIFVLLALLAACGTNAPAVRRIDPAVVQPASSARVAFEAGRMDEAVRLYRRALQRARFIGDGLSIARSAHNLAACLLVLGHPDQAHPFLYESLLEYRRLNLPVVETQILEVKALRLEGKISEAERLARQVLATVGADHPEYKAQLHIIEVHLACDRNDAHAARSCLDEAKPWLGAVGDSAIQAAAAGAGGRAFLLEGRYASAAAAFDREAAFWRETGQYRSMALALQNAAAAYKNAGWPLRAADRFYCAARSLDAQGDSSSALRNIEEALDMVQSAQGSGAAGNSGMPGAPGVSDAYVSSAPSVSTEIAVPFASSGALIPADRIDPVNVGDLAAQIALLLGEIKEKVARQTKPVAPGAKHEEQQR